MFIANNPAAEADPVTAFYCLPVDELKQRFLLLTETEMQVCVLLAETQAGDQEIAASMIISHRTVNKHLGSVKRKLDAPNRTAIAVAALRAGVAKVDGLQMDKNEGCADDQN